MSKRFVRSLLGIAVLVLFASPLEMVGQSFKGSLVVGGTTSQIGGDYLSGFNKWGVFGGPSVSYPLKDKLDLTLQILYTQKGSKASNDEFQRSNPRGFWEELELNYFDVPIMAEYKVSEQVIIQGGLAVEYLLSAKLNNSPALTSSEELNLRDFSINGLVGARYKLSSRFSFLGRLNSSLIPINKGDLSLRAPGSASRKTDFRNRPFNLMINFGLRYSLGAL